MARLLRLVAVFGMFWPKDLLQNSERFLKEQFGFGVLAHNPIQRGQVIEALRRVAMLGADVLLPDPKRFLIERFGLGVFARIHSAGRLGY